MIASGELVVDVAPVERELGLLGGAGGAVGVEPVEAGRLPVDGAAAVDFITLGTVEVLGE